MCMDSVELAIMRCSERRARNFDATWQNSGLRPTERSTPPQMSAPSIEALATLSPAELRTRLPELFAAINAADDASAPLVASLAGRAFDGNEGLDVLRDPLSVPFALRGLGHTDSQVRSLTAQQMTRLASTAADVNLLKERGLLSTLASLIDDEVLSVSQRAAEVFTACAAAGAEPLRIVLTDEPTMQKLR